MLHHVLPILLVEMRQYFSIGLTSERVSALFEILAYLAIVVDFAVEYCGYTLIFVVDGLFAGNQIDDREATPSERSAIYHQQHFGIRSAMNHALAHRMQEFFRALRRRCV